ncbi:MAG TPA: carboxypeptidase regulatory-like domain-containing protein, partial [Thermoanaerobaculia bacterium]|nr:carboxypeptidase regulatory-like domain-containing protein [Thermoanaerobaculia bacterium]
MKRTLHLLLAVLMITSVIGTADAKTKRKSKKKDTAIDQVAPAGLGGGDEEGRERLKPAPRLKREKKQLGDPDAGVVIQKPGPIAFGKPIEFQLKRASSRHFDLRSLPRTGPVQMERAELPEPGFHPVTIQGTVPEPSTPVGNPVALAPAPPPIAVYEGLDRFNWGAGSPPDTNGDVGPNNYIQTVNTSIGVYRKSDGFQQAAFTFNTFMSQGAFGNLCDTNNFGDPVVLYDTFEDRWIISDFAFTTDISGNVLAPAFQCFAASMTGDPVSGGWSFYSIQITDALNDYPKLGVWPDGIYMSANLFTFGAGSTFKNARAWAFNKAQMYAGSPTVKVVAFDIGGGDFAVMPSNARLQTGTPPPGRPNLFVSTEEFLNALTVYKFHVDWNNISLSTFTGPDEPLAATSWPNAAVANAAQPGTATLLDVLQIRAMVQNQYTNFGGVESIWVPHTVRRGNTTGFAAPRWYQADVTGGTVAANLVQATTWDPDAANVINRFMPSLALDRVGNMAMGYSTSNGTTGFPSIKYAGRLAADPINTFSQTEQIFFTGTASQTGINRWGDYSAMTLDPDGCTFWYTSEYANPADQTFDHRWLTKFGSIPAFPGCVPVGAGGTVSGTVTVNPGGAPISGATVNLGAGRSTTTDGSGNYSFTGVPAGTYPSMTATKPGFVSGSASSIVVTDGGTTTQNFSLTAAPASACLTDTTQADFQTGVASATLDINTSPGDITLSNAPASDQANTAGTTTGTGFGTPNWTGQTFIAGVTGLLVKADGQLFCNGCGATPPDLTLSVRATAAGLPTGADLATATILGAQFASGATVLFTGTFGTPLSITSGTQYALILRPVSVPAGSGYFWIRSSPSTYANGSRVLSADSGGTWSSDTTRDYNFRTYVQTGYAASGTFVSSPKDSNPAGGNTPIWSTFSWNATVPANTTLQFQLAGSNNPNGPFNFVGPDGTAGTFFTTSPVQLSPQFYNLRFLEYKAFFATTDPNFTPTLSDATACFNNVDCSSTVATITPTPATVCSSSAGNTASGPAGMTAYAWGIANGTITSATNIQTITYTAGASGTVTLSLTVTSPNGCIVSGSTPVTISGFPATPTITPTPAQVCANSAGNSAAGPAGATTYAWSIVNGTITSATNIQTITYTAGASGTVDLTLTVTNAAGCATPNTVSVTINANPATPAITPTPASVCPSSAGNSAAGPAGATSYAWSITNGTITSATNIQTITYTAGASGTVSLTLVVTNASGCSATNTSNVTINPNPATPTITPTPAQVCASSTGNSAAGPAGATTYAWSISNGTITSATNIQTITYTAGASGTVGLTLTVTNGSGCSASNSANVTINPNPNATITAAATTPSGSTGNVASTANAGVGATYAWSVTGGTLTGGNNTPSITYTAGAPGTLTINLTVTTAAGCSDTKSANVTVTAPLVTVTSVSPVGGTIAGGSAVTINGTGFNAGATVTFGGSAATNVVVVSSIKITARTPAHAAGSVNVTVTNTDTSNGTLTNGYLYKPQQFDPNNDGTISAMDIFYLVNYLYMGGPAPAGAAGLLSGDANGDGVVNPLDIFYLVNYLFLGGPRPNSIPIGPVTAMAVGTDAAHLDGSIALGKAVLRNGHYVVPVIMTAGQGS